MKRMKNYLMGLLCAVALMIFAVSCDNNDEIKTIDPDETFDAILKVDENDVINPNVDVSVGTKSTIKAKVSFTSTTSMKRLYITQNIGGQGEEKYTPSENIDLKGDGSVDLEKGSGTSFEFKFELPIPFVVGGNGTVVYKFWTTSGAGDFRDESKRYVAGPGTITLKAGTAVNPDALVKEYKNKQLSTPTADGLSKTFISLLDGEIYKINQGQEYIAFWDFGYINIESDKSGPALYSTSTYPESAITSLKDLPAAEKNTTYFRVSDKTSVQFDAVKIASDLSFITEPTDTYIKGLVTGDIVEFVDEYGKKGMIKVISATPGNESNKFIEISIKVQP